MPRGKQLTQREKDQIDALHEVERSYTPIAIQMGRFVSKRCAYGDKKRTGKLSARDIRHIACSESNSTKSATQIMH